MKDKGRLEKEVLSFSTMSDRRTIEALRRACGLETVTLQTSPCLRCQKVFEAQYLGKRRTEFYCPPCAYNMAKIDRCSLE